MRVEVDPGFFEIAGTSGKARVSQAHLGLATDATQTWQVVLAETKTHLGPLITTAPRLRANTVSHGPSNFPTFNPSIRY